MRNIPYEPTLNDEYHLTGLFKEHLKIRLRPIDGAGDFPTVSLRSNPPGSEPLATIYHDEDDNTRCFIRLEGAFRWTTEQLLSKRPCCIRADLIYDALKRFMLQNEAYRTFENWKNVGHEYYRVCIEEGIPKENAATYYDAIMNEWVQHSSN